MILKDVFLQIVERFKLLENFFTTEGYSKINHFDLFYNQYDRTHDSHPFATPAIFLEIGLDCEDAGQLAQNTLGVIRVHVCQENYAHSADGSDNQDIALRVLDFVDLVHQALHGHKDKAFGKMYRRRVLPDTDTSNFVTYVLEYTCAVTDDNTHRLKDYILNGGDGNLDLDVQLVEKIPPPPVIEIQGKYYKLP